MSVLEFALTPANEASAPAPERDEVRLLVAKRGRALVHDMFRGLPSHLRAGDLLVVNTSATIPAALSGGRLRAAPLDARCPVAEGTGRWVVELRRCGARYRGGSAGQRLALPGGGSAELLAPYLSPGRLWIAALDLPAPLRRLPRRARPADRVRAPDAPAPRSRTCRRSSPTSPAAPRCRAPAARSRSACSTSLLAHGVQVAPLVLHTGVSSLELGERPYPERYRVPALTATRVNAHRAAGGRVIAVGTTVVRALETVAGPDGRVEAGEGWTGLTITPERGVRAVDGLLTGWHEPDASHLLMLEAVGGRELVERSYAAALAAGYRWHEFGDTHLILR